MTRRFSLAVLLLVREQREKAEERVLAETNAQLSALHQVLRRVADELSQLAKARASQLETVRLAVDYVAFESRRKSLHSAQAEIQAQIQTVQAKLHEQQRTYVRARCDREALTELRDQHRKEWENYENVRDQKGMTDLFNARRKLN